MIIPKENEQLKMIYRKGIERAISEVRAMKEPLLNKVLNQENLTEKENQTLYVLEDVAKKLEGCE